MAMQGFKHTLSWANDFTEVDNAPEGFSDRSARTKANVTLDPKMIAKRNNKESDGKKDAEQAKWELHITGLMNKTDGELKGI